jgi:hypothetical protein
VLHILRDFYYTILILIIILTRIIINAQKGTLKTEQHFYVTKYVDILALLAITLYVIVAM